ncbi:MAG: SpoIID/LytB domain-containing protein [Spirochaetes bacterium]|nr:SpoIID/LytB domain-containing protein [Spirochaetota bacterium]
MIFKVVFFTAILSFYSISAHARTARINILSKYDLNSIVITADSGSMKSDEGSFTLDKSRIIINADKENLSIRHQGRFISSKAIAISTNNSAVIYFGKNLKRKYPGDLIIQSRNDKLIIINSCEFDTYIHSAAVAESKGLIDKSPYYTEFIKVMEICARSYLLANGDRHSEKEWEFCDLTHCMHYEGLLDDGKSFSAGEILIDSNGKPVECFFHSTCGGLLTKPDVFWENHTGSTFREGNDFINGKSLCEKSPHYSWTAKTDFRKLSKVFRLQGLNGIDAIYKNGRVSKIIFKTETENVTVDIPRFMSICGRAYGWNFIKSNYFTIKIENGSVLFFGKGLGHGVGLCQYGAAEMIRNGASYIDVLNFYFPGAELSK